MDRTTFIGGSDIAAVMGLSRWETPLSIWAQKTGVIPPKDLSDNEAVEMGIGLESFVAQKFEERSGKKVVEDSNDYTHPEYDFIKCHIDRDVADEPDAILECKTASAYKAREWEDDDVPDDYLLQCNLYCGVLGKKRCYIAVLIGGQKFVWKTIEFNKALYDEQIEAAVDFWENFVIPKIPPMAMSNDKDTLVEMYPESRPDSMQVLRGESPEAETVFNQLVNDYLEGKAQMKALEVEVEEAGNKLRQIIGDLESVETGMAKVSWKSQKKTSLDIVRLKEDGLYSTYANVSSHRILRVVEKKAKNEQAN